MKERQALEIAQRLYEGVLAPSGWADALSQIRDAVQSDAACMILRDKSTKAAFIGDQTYYDSGMLDEYMAHYYAYDPGYDVADRYDVGDWFVDWRDLDRSILDKGEFHQGFLRGYGLRSVQATPVMKTDSVECFLSLQYGLETPQGETPDQSVLLQWLQPHLQQAANLRYRLHTLQRQGELAVRVLDTFSFPVMVVNIRGAVQLANRAADDWLSLKGNPFGGSGLRQTIIGSPSIAHVLAEACSPNRKLAASGVALELGAPPQQHYLVAVPLPEAMSTPLTALEPLALLMVHPARHEQVQVDMLLRVLFGISPAEYRLIEKLMLGLAIKECAFELGISTETARSQLKSIFRRTRTSRQVELLRLIQQLTYGH